MRPDLPYDMEAKDMTEAYWKEHLAGCEPVQRGPWGILIKIENYPIYVAPEKKFVFRTVRPMAPMGPWMVYRFSYKNKFYTSLVDDIWGYCTIKKI